MLCGVFAGLQLAHKHPEVLRSLTVIAGAADSEPPAQVRRLPLLASLARLIGVRPPAGLILHAQLALRPEVGHCSTIEEAPAVNRRLSAFLQQVAPVKEQAHLHGS